MRPIGRAQMDHETAGRRHPLIDHAADRLRSGSMDRRAFLRMATLLGMSVGAASAMAGGAAAQSPAQASGARPAQPRPGGVLRCGMPIQAVLDPAQFAWIEMSNQLRHQNEHLTITGPDNLTRPMLAKAWAASDDLKTWTFQLREGVKWRNGDVFDAGDVAFNVARWLDPATRSSNLGLFAAMTEVFTPEGGGPPERRAIDGALEVVDPLTVRFHLSSPVLSMPENLYNYPTAILHRGFSGDILADANGTGPYRLVESIPGERATLRKIRQPDWRYWGTDVAHIGPGWVEKIRYRHFDAGGDAAVEALAAGEIDLTYELDVEQMRSGPPSRGVDLFVAETTQAPIMRMRVDKKPFDDVRVRRAIQLCCDARAFPRALFADRGREGEHHHVAQLHPEYFPLPRQRRDVEAAKRLLAEAGHPNGIDVTLDVGNTSGRWQQRCCELLRDQAKEAGVRITVNTITPSEYEATWRDRDFGLTQWGHRPLGTMALSLGYRSGVPWNESRYANPEFDAALTKAEALLDLGARQEAMEAVQQMLQRDAVMVQPCWRPVAFLASKRVQGIAAHPTLYHQFNGVWLAA